MDFLCLVKTTNQNQHKCSHTCIHERKSGPRNHSVPADDDAVCGELTGRLGKNLKGAKESSAQDCEQSITKELSALYTFDGLFVFNYYKT